MECLLVRSVQVLTPQCTQVRGMATLKDIRLRLKSITNIQKITKSMKMVSASKFSRAERELKPARSYGKGAQELIILKKDPPPQCEHCQCTLTVRHILVDCPHLQPVRRNIFDGKAFYQQADVKQDDSQPNHLLIAMTSDRGLCGGIHSSISKTIRSLMYENKAGAEPKIVCIGDKSKAMLSRLFKQNILLTFNDIGKRPPVFADASLIATAIIESGFKYDVGKLYFNVYRTVVSYTTTEMPLFSLEAVKSAEKLNLYDSLDDDVIISYNEFALASLLYFAMKEGACSEQSSRMTAMDGATKNAGEMIDKLTLTFNRTRQAVITRELIEIISGAAAL